MITMNVSPSSSITNMMEELGDTFDGLDVCLKAPGQNVFYEYSASHFPAHAACPAINGILKCIEAKNNLALKKDAYIKFIAD